MCLTNNQEHFGVGALMRLSSCAGIAFAMVLMMADAVSHRAQAQHLPDGTWSPKGGAAGDLEFFNAPASRPTQSFATIALVHISGEELQWIIVFDPRDCPDSMTFSNLQFGPNSRTRGKLEGEYCRGTRMRYLGNMPINDFIKELNKRNVIENGRAIDIDFDTSANNLYSYGEIKGFMSVMQAHYDNLLVGQTVATRGMPSGLQMVAAIARSSTRYFGGTLTQANEQAMPSPFGGVGYYIKRKVSGVRCRKLAPTRFSCEYDRSRQSRAARDSLWGSIASIGESLNGNDGSRHFTDIFVRNGLTWSSPTADATNARARAAAIAAANAARSTADDSATSAYEFEQKSRERFREEKQAREDMCAWVSGPCW